MLVVEGDLFSCEFVADVNGFMGDNTKTFRVGKVSDAAEKLLRVTEEALYKGIEQAVAGNRIGDISNAIQTHVEANGFAVCRKYIGHGIGRDMHEDPEVPNFGRPGRGPRLCKGMTLAIEPMVNTNLVYVNCCVDGWTVLSTVCSLSSHIE